MRKHFLKISLIGLLAVSMPASFTSCKDYDDDIEALNKENDELSKQLAALKEASTANSQAAAAAAAAAEEAKKAADNAQAAGDAAAAAAAAAKQDAELAKQAAAKAKQDAIDAAIAEINKLKGSIATQETVDALATRVSAIEAGLNKLSGKVDVNAQAIAQLQIQMKAVEAYKALIDANASAIKNNADKIAAIEKSIATIQSSIKTLEANVGKVGQDMAALEKQVEGELEKCANEIAAVNGNLLTILAKELRSLVFIPELYADGIESTEYGYPHYTVYNGAGGTSAELEFTTLSGEKQTAKVIDTKEAWKFNAGGKSSFSPVWEVKYHLNPSSAEVNTEDLAFVSQDVQVISRGNDSGAKPEVIASKSEGGILTVSYKANGLGIEKEDGSVMALQAEIKRSGKADTTITSDYALLYGTEVEPAAIAFNSNLLKNLDCPDAKRNDELYRTVEDVTKAKPTFTVNYNGSIDLSKYLETHYNWYSNTKNGINHGVWNYEAEKFWGFHYEYALVDYIVGQNNTSDSKYATIDKNTGVLTPCIVDSKGNSLVGQQGVSSIGRVPLVKVTLVDSKGKVALYAFIRVEIAFEHVDKVTDTFKVGADIEFSCNDATVGLTWSETSYELLEKTACKSKTEFEELYVLDSKVVEEETVARQYTSVGGNERNPYVGKIFERFDPTGAATTVIEWTLSMEDQQYVYEQPNHSVTVYIAYQYKVSPRLYPVIYMPLTVTVKKPEAGSIGEKNGKYWFGFNEDGTINDAGEYAAGLNVQYPADHKNTLDYTVDYHQVWVDNELKWSYGPIHGYQYYFSAETNGNIGGYNITVGNDNEKNVSNAVCILGHKAPVSEENALKHAFWANQGEYTNNALYANGVMIAKLDQNSGKITYLANETSKALLNMFDSEKPGMYVKVGVCIWNTCDVAYALKNGVNPAYFLRPLNVREVDGCTFVDAENNASYVNVFDGLSFSDWREEDLSKPNNGWLFAFYNVKSVTINLADMDRSDIPSDMILFSYIPQGSTDKILDKYTVNIEWDNDTENMESASAAVVAKIKAAMGQIMYENNGNPVEDFKVKIPVTIEYDWGKYTVYPTYYVKGTIGQ